MTGLKKYIGVITVVTLQMLLLASCGQRKGSYDIDSLIEGYVLEEGTEYVDLDNNRNKNQQNTEEAKEKELPGLSTDSASLALAAKADEAMQASLPGGSAGPGRIRVRYIGPLAQVFNDSNYRQYAYAEKLGITPINNLSDAFHSTRAIVKVTSNSDYTVDELTHSLPFLVPEAERLLSDIGRNFQDSLKKRGPARYRIRATSLLRTPATVKALRKVNINATDSSTHQFGTTFDLSYNRFHNLDSRYEVAQEDLKNLLGEVLYDLRREGRCLVKFEVKTGCYHVTVTK